MKTCTSCEQRLPIDKFYTNQNIKGGRLNQCMPCVRVAQRARTAARTPDQCSAESIQKRAARERRLYGTTREQLFCEQGPLCPICKRDLTLMRSNAVVIDHCHRSGHRRGLICHNCNVALGKFGDDPETLLRAVNYLIGI